MLRIDCPFCGPRDETEFAYVGDAKAHRPAADSDARAFYEYVYLRDNPRGPHEEIWQHTGGCRSFVQVRRNTQTHVIVRTSKPGQEIAT